MPDARSFHDAVASWYARNARVLPWRGIADSYAILVSEVMLQQTQVERVIPKYRAFLDAFPTLHALANAQPADVIRLWAGMGYNGRAVRLRKLAWEVVEHHNGELPRTADELRKLSGIGPYTAAAVASFAFGEPVPVLDTNIYRVLSRVVHGIDAPSRDAIHPLAESLLPQPDSPITPADWHQALMDIGATLCTARQPRCMLCPSVNSAPPHRTCSLAATLRSPKRPSLMRHGNRGSRARRATSAGTSSTICESSPTPASRNPRWKASFGTPKPPPARPALSRSPISSLPSNAMVSSAAMTGAFASRNLLQSLYQPSQRFA